MMEIQSTVYEMVSMLGRSPVMHLVTGTNYCKYAVKVADLANVYES